MNNREAQKKISEWSILLFVTLGMISMIILWGLISGEIRKASTRFYHSDHFPITGTFISSQYKKRPDEVRASKLILEQYEVQGDENHYLMMTYQSDGKQGTTKLVFIVEKWRQLLMRKRDKSYGTNNALRLKEFIDEKGKSFDFQSTCRLIGRNDSFGPSFGRRLGTDKSCYNHNQENSLKGYFSRSGDSLCIDIRVRTRDKDYHIEHRSDAMRCLKAT